MIIKMKKTSIVVLDSIKEQSMETLRGLGLVHLELKNLESEKMTELQDKKTLLNSSLGILKLKSDEDIKQNDKKNFDAAIDTAEKIDSLNQELFNLNEKISHLDRDIKKQSGWGDFDPEDIISLDNKGVHIKLFELNKDQLKQFPESAKLFSVNKTKTQNFIAAVYTDEKIEFPFDETQLPSVSLSDLNKQRVEKQGELERVDKEIFNLLSQKDLIQYGLDLIDEKLEFENVVTNMGVEDKLTYITGYAPTNKIDDLKKTASQNGWGLMITDPSDGDEPPTLVENPKWVQAIKPVFGLLGTIPGYKEFDISIWFLMFFSVFWAMIMGDAGYGLIFLVLTIFLRIKFKKASFEPFLLLFITSFTTIIWGGMTGNWFGVETLTTQPGFADMIVPKIASFTSVAEGQVDMLIMHICFIIGCIHLSVAHVLNMIRILPSLKGIAEVGWLSVLWGLYFIIRTLVLKMPAFPYALYMILGGILCVIIFAEQEGNFVKGVKKGFANLILIALSTIGFFSDIVSYVRLFAVGLATLEVAKSFNAMAAGLGSGVVAFIGGAFILFFGHGLNIILGSMSLIVHGVRLNMLEFSGHLGMEWSGYEYKPFKKNVK